jgi:pimeloyl-ACP methyl ester carboxylesterase
VKQIELSAGTIECSDTGGDRPVLVLLHGLMMDASLWDGLMADVPRSSTTRTPSATTAAPHSVAARHRDKRQHRKDSS